MRLILAAATIGACLAAGHIFGASETPLAGQSPMEAQHVSLEIGKQARPSKPPPRGPGGGGNDSCRWANDRECDEPDIGTGACQMGTDVSDCRAMRAGDDDSCRWARDGECDDPNFGTGACVQGTDRTDCGAVAWMRNQNDSCATSFNGSCEEPGRGSGCAARTDRSDCRGRQRPMTINDHFFGRDDRVRVNAQDLPWRYIGMFTNGAGERCTATLIARDVIVTAAHCINTDEGIRADGTFQPEAGGPSARTSAYFLSPQFNYQRFNSTDEIDGLDWSLLRIDQPLGERWGFAGTRVITGQGTAAARAFDLYQAGYSWDTGGRLSANIACHIVEVQSRENTFAHECDTTRGDSGSAFLVQNGNRWDVIGVDSNFRNNPGGAFIYIAVSAASFQPYVADFVANRIGTPVGEQAGFKPKLRR